MLQYVMHQHVGHHVGYARYGAIETHVDAPHLNAGRCTPIIMSIAITRTIMGRFRRNLQHWYTRVLCITCDVTHTI